MGYTLEELQKMGAKPVAHSAAPAAPTQKKSYTADELESLGATPVSKPESETPAAQGMTAAPKMSLKDKFLSLEKGVAKGAGDSIVGMSRTGSAFANQTAGRVVSAIEGKGFKPLANKDLGNLIENPESDVSKKVDETLASKNNYERAGKVAEFGAEFLVPGKAIKNVAEAAPIVKSLIASRDATRVKKLTNTVGQILQGEGDDIERGRKALTEIDTRGVKTYKQGEERLNEHIGAISSKLDEAYDTDKVPRTLNALSVESTVGGQKIKQNFVEKAIEHLKNNYTKTENVQAATEMDQLLAKAQSTGITPREVNELARRYGRDISGFNANGELASGLSKQAAENTRKGLKATARGLLNSPIAREADARLTDLIRTRDLFTEMSEKVNALKQKTISATLPQRVGKLIEQAVNIATLGSSRGLFQAVAKASGVLTKNSANAVELEKVLAKNLKLLQKASDNGASESQVIKALEEFIRGNGQKPLLMLPAPGETARASKILYAGEKGAASHSAQEASDLEKVRTGVVKQPQRPGLKQFGPASEYDESYSATKDLPIIKFGNGLKKPKKSGLPTIR